MHNQLMNKGWMKPSLAILAMFGVLISVAIFVPQGALAQDSRETAAVDALPSPVGYWRMEAFDSGPQLGLNTATGEYDAQYVNGAKQFFDSPDNNISWPVGNPGSSDSVQNSNSVLLDDATEYVLIDPSPAYDLTTEMTLTAWVKLVDGKELQYLITKFDAVGGGLPQGYSLFLADSDLGAILAMEVYDANGHTFLIQSPDSIAANTWTHVAATWEMGGASALYVNGVEVESAIVGADPIGTGCDEAGGCPVAIGPAPTTIPIGIDAIGNMDEVMIFNTALDADQVAALAQRTFIVNTADSAGTTCNGQHCSLRAALELANAAPNGALSDRIHFNVPEPAIIQPGEATQLPTVTDPVIVDGLTQPGASCAGSMPTVKVALDGSDFKSANGLTVISTDVTISGLNIRNYSQGYGILLGPNAKRVQVTCNAIGTDLTGQNVAPNGAGILSLNSGAEAHNAIVLNLISGNLGEGITLVNTADNFILANYIGTDITGQEALGNGSGINLSGGADRNSISGNTISANSNDGLLVGTSLSNTIMGNYVGTDITGQEALGNGGNGIILSGGSNENTISGNLISANSGHGLLISASQQNVINSNATGTDFSAAVALGNGGSGIVLAAGSNTNSLSGNVISGNNEDGLVLASSSNNLIFSNLIGTDGGGTAVLGNGNRGILLSSGASQNTLDSNVVSGNGGVGIEIQTASESTVFKSNLIGTDATGNEPLGNGGHGVAISGDANNTFIGEDAFSGNTIAFNNGDGVNMVDGEKLSVFNNSIHSNTGLGIDLGDDGPDTNDLLDSDGGANSGQNFPILTEAVVSSGTTAVSGTLHSTPNMTFIVEFFANNTTESCQGHTPLQVIFVVTGTDGNAAFNATLPGIPVGFRISATAARITTLETSEFSACETVVAESAVEYGVFIPVTLK